MRAYLLVILSALACNQPKSPTPQSAESSASAAKPPAPKSAEPLPPSQPTKPASQDPTDVKYPEPETIIHRGKESDLTLDLFRTGGSFYWLTRDKQRGLACDHWSVIPNPKYSDKKTARGTIAFQWKDPRGIEATTSFGYSYFFVGKSMDGIETLPAFKKALEGGMGYEEAKSKYTKYHQSTWWMDLTGPSVQAKDFGSSLGCAEGHPISSFSKEAILYGTELWFLTQVACEAAVKAAQTFDANSGC